MYLNDHNKEDSISSMAKRLDRLETVVEKTSHQQGIDEAVDEVEDGAQGRKVAISPWRWHLTFLALLVAGLLYGLDTTIAADVQVPIYQTFGGITKLPWVGIGFPMGSVAVILLLGKAYALFDVKVLSIASIVVFEIGSVLCGAAPSFDALIAGRVIAGIGGCGMYLGALTYVKAFQVGRQAALYNALIGISWGIGAILGPVVGGSFSESKATWRWAFYINLPLAALCAPINLFVFPKHDPKPSSCVSVKLGQIDWLGAVLISPVFVLLIVVMTFQGSQYTWSSTFVISMWVIWGLSLIGFIIQQSLTPLHKRLFPTHFLCSRTMVLLYIATAVGGVLISVPLFYIPLYFGFTRGDSALQAAVRLLPFICVFIVSVLLSGGFLTVYGRYSICYILGGVFATVGGSLMFTCVDTMTSTATVYGFEVLLAIAAGLTLQNGYAIAVAKQHGERDRSDAVGFINVAQIGTIAIALAICGCFFQNLGFDGLKKELAVLGLSDDVIRSALSGRESPIYQDEQIRPLLPAVLASITNTISSVYGVVIGGGATLLVAGLAMRWEKIDLEASGGG